MHSSLLIQPNIQLGTVIAGLLSSEARYERISFVSAFASLRTLLRLRELILARRDAGCEIRVVVGIDLDGTSREVLQELLGWHCKSFVFQNAAPRSTFHPKVYFFEGTETATILVGSNNFTDGGLFTNHEASARFDYQLPIDSEILATHNNALDELLRHEGSLLLPLSQELISALVARGQVPSEEESRKRRNKSHARTFAVGQNVPENPFGSLSVKLPPLLAAHIRAPDAEVGLVVSEPKLLQRDEQRVLEGVLVWQKKLPNTDALQVQPGTNVVGGVRLTQARFEFPIGQRIDQTTYFRNLFSDFYWEPEEHGHLNQEHTFVPMRIRIDGVDYGVRNFEISHKPSGEAGQDNYTTILRWGRDFSPVIKNLSLAGRTLSLYETNDEYTPFLIEIH